MRLRRMLSAKWSESRLLAARIDRILFSACLNGVLIILRCALLSAQAAPGSNRTAAGWLGCSQLPVYQMPGVLPSCLTNFLPHHNRCQKNTEYGLHSPIGRLQDIISTSSSERDLKTINRKAKRRPHPLWKHSVFIETVNFLQNDVFCAGTGQPQTPLQHSSPHTPNRQFPAYPGPYAGTAAGVRQYYSWREK